MTLYLQDATYIDSETFAQTRGNIAVAPGPFGGIRLNAAIPCVAERNGVDSVIDVKGRFVMRSFVCGHHHIYSALSRGMPPAAKTPTNFVEVLQYVWWHLDKCLDNEITAASALVAAMHMAKNGVTFCIDHHASPFAVEGSLRTIAKAFEQVGLGHLLCYEISDRDGKEIAEKGLAEHDAWLGAGNKGHVGLHASFTVSDDTLKKAVKLAEKHKTGIHIHVAEAASDQEHCHNTYGHSVIRRLKNVGALELPQTILAHCVHLSDEDKKIISESPCWIVQNAESNMNNNVGLGKYNFHNNVMYGTDGMHSDMLRSAQSAYFAGIPTEGINCAEAYKRFRAAHRHIALHNAPGDSDNNLIILDYDSPTPFTQDNAFGHIFYGLDAGHVHTVISKGKVIVENRQLKTCSENDILGYAQKQAKRLWAKMQS